MEYAGTSGEITEENLRLRALPYERGEIFCMEAGRKKEKNIIVLYFLLYLAAALTIAFHQPLYDTPPLFSNPPDEHSRYRVSLYICSHGTLPTGYEEELLSADCKWSYGFHTLLPYMVQGYAMRFVNLFTDSPLVLLYTARLVNVITGLLTAYVVMLLSRKLFSDNRLKWVFCFLVTFMPQSLFLHTYANPDSMCLLSVALILYGLVRGYGDDFSLKSCALLAFGVILCALSYYNAYGYILGAVLLFSAYYLKKDDKRNRFLYDWKGFWKKGILISVTVLLFTGWSFIRNYLLYDGDIIGLSAKNAYIESFGIMRDAFRDQGKSLPFMLFRTAFFPKMVISFIACYGSATLYTWKIVYVFYLILFGGGIAGACFCRKKTEEAIAGEKWKCIFFHAVMIACMVMPLFLTIYYSYTVDYQAQGRYAIPGLVPFMYYVTCGLGKLPVWENGTEEKKNVLNTVIIVGTAVSLLITVYVMALPVYLQTPVL